jgi:hypothetical protein
MSRLAIVDRSGGVVTFVRSDTPPGWEPPEGCRAVLEASLPSGWKAALPPPPPTPKSITAVQARHWLILRGLVGSVDTAIEKIQSPVDREMVRAWWAHSTDLRRDSPQVARWATACGYSPEQVDTFFAEAASIGGTA